MEEKKDKHIQQDKSLMTRVKATAVILPILFFMLYFRFLFTILMILVIYLSYNEFYKIQTNILSFLFRDYYAEITWKTLISSPLTAFIFMLCPIILYIKEDVEIFACLIPLSVIIMVRIGNFILIHRLINSNERNFKTITEDKFIKSNEKEKIVNDRIQNPIKAIINKNETSLEKNEANIDKNENTDKNNEVKGFGFFNKLVKFNPTQVKYFFQKNIEEKATKEKTQINQVISLNMFNACFIIIMLDFVFFFVYAYPTCLGISMLKYDGGFAYLSMIVVIAYQCDNGALFAGKLFGQNQFGSPVTPTKTVEGLYGAFLFGFISSYIFRYFLTTLTNVSMLPHFPYFVCTCCNIFTAIIGDFFESFLKRCANVKDSGKLIPGHGGLLDRIDSLTLGVPINFYFLKQLINIK